MREVSDLLTDLTPEEKRTLLARLLRERAAAEAPASPLSHGQRALWFMYRLDPYSSAYNIMLAVYVRADLDREAICRAFQNLVHRHSILRTTYGDKEGQPMQHVHRQRRFELETIDATHLSPEQLHQRIQQLANVRFDLEKGPVFRVQLLEQAANRHILILTAHHIAMDFWSFDLLLEELETLYRGEVSGMAVELPPVRVQYGDYVRWQEKMLRGPQGQHLWTYWQQQLAGALPQLNLPTDRPRRTRQSFTGATFHFRVSDDLANGITALAESMGGTLYTMLLAAFYILLHRYSGQQDILVGSPTAGRNHADFEGIFGYFLNPMVLRARLEPDMRFSDFFAQIRETVIDGINHQDFPFPLLVEKLQPPRDASRSPIFQVAFNWDKPRRLTGRDARHGGKSAQPDIGSLGLEPFALEQQGAAFDLTLMMLNLDRSLSGAMQYNTDLFDKDTIEQMVNHYQVILEGIVREPGCRVCKVPLLTAEELQLLENWNDTRAAYPRHATLSELLEAQVTCSPDSLAVGHNEHWLTYRQLHERAHRLARFLNQCGVGPNVLVGIYIERSLDMIVALLGVLKAGGAYVPLDPAYPRERLRIILSDARPSVVLTHSDLAVSLPENQARIVCLDGDWRISDDTGVLGGPVSHAGPEDLAYVIYTSGSTGIPKGVKVHHRALVNFLTAMKEFLRQDDVLMAVTTISFDIAALEIYGPLMVGARTVIIDQRTATDGILLAESLKRNRATIMQATPTTWRLLLQSGWTAGEKFRALCGGEVMSRDLANRLLECCSDLWNMYGPTEATVWSMAYKVIRQDYRDTVPIGKPIANTQIYILDAAGQPVPFGVVGELYIGGDGVSSGYINHTELTRDKFIPHPFEDSPHVRLYRTGDLARLLPDGNVEFLGRLDHQVKVNGFRIELAEIEAQLLKHPAVREVVLTAQETCDGASYLVAYIVRTGLSEATLSDPIISDLQRLVKDYLPSYMAPARYVFLDSFPLTPSGKIDHKALPAPDTKRPVFKHDYLAPRNSLEMKLADVWAQVLKMDRVGIEDNFFDLGGASAQCLEVVVSLRGLGVHLTPAAIFEHQTVAELSRAISSGAVSRSMANLVDLQSPQMENPPAEVSSRHWVESIKSSTLVIESLGVYLPEHSVSTQEVLDGCRKKVRFPLERMTGIRSRRVSVDSEYSIDLARKAIDECLKASKYTPEQIDLLISCSISRYDSPDRISFEPSTAVKLRDMFGFKHALAFDISNACAGMFTGIMISDALVKAGEARCAMVVSGEYISHLISSAQREIEGFLDPRLACLTVGDAGAAIILERSPSEKVGFHDIDMYTLGKYSSLCIAKITDQAHGGAIMYTDSVKQTAVAAKNAVMHSSEVMQRSGFSPESFDRLIMHQTSKTALYDVSRVLNDSFGRPVCHDGNMVYNLAERGNTATTSHFVAMNDLILSGGMKSFEKVLFGISGSGQTVGTALYTVDDLPDRLRSIHTVKKSPYTGRQPVFRRKHPRTLVRIAGLGTLPYDHDVGRNAVELARRAAENCIQDSPYQARDIDLLIHAGVYRNDYLAEPALAALLAGSLKMNDDIKSCKDRKTFVFDVFNGAVGYLNACYIGGCLIRMQRFKTAMITASEIENNSEDPAENLRGVAETGAAVILDSDQNGAVGFGQFVFKYATEFIGALSAYTVKKGEGTFLHIERDSGIENYYQKPVLEAVGELLAIEGLNASAVSAVFAPQMSVEFCGILGKRLGIDNEKFVTAVDHEKDLFTCALPYSLQRARDAGRVVQGDVALIVSVGSGIQVGCSVYYC